MCINRNVKWRVDILAHRRRTLATILLVGRVFGNRESVIVPTDVRRRYFFSSAYIKFYTGTYVPR